jgi:hypothetical protein
MKKIINFSILLILLVIFTPKSALAISGACSAHLGVNCNAGPASAGKVLCNDGWVNSSVYYSDMEECKSPVPTCTYPSSWSGCRTEDDYTRISAQVRSENFNSGPAFMDAALDRAQTECRNSINSYQNVISQYNQCVSSSSQQNSYYQNKQIQDSPPTVLEGMNIWCKEEYGDSSTYNLVTERCILNEKQLQAVCATQFGENAIGVVTSQKCNCANGYFMDKENKCSSSKETLDAQCTPIYGANSYYKDDLCYCNDGYEMNDSVTQCIKILKNNSNPNTTSGKIITPKTSVTVPQKIENTSLMADQGLPKFKQLEVVDSPKKNYTTAIIVGFAGLGIGIIIVNIIIIYLKRKR